MKTAEEWINEPNELDKCNCECEGRATNFILWVKQIQLDAIKEGMCRAVGVVNKYAEKCSIHDCGDCGADDILITAEQLTEKDL